MNSIKKKETKRVVLLLAGEACILLIMAACWRFGRMRLGTLGLGVCIMALLDAVVAMYRYDQHRRGEEGCKKKWSRLLIVLLMGLLVTLPLLTDYVPYGHDLEFHLMRIEGIAGGLKDGQFPVKIHPDTAGGYGYAVSVFYPDLLLYVPAVLRLMGVSVMNAYKLFCFLINLLTAAVSYYSFSRIFRSKQLGLVGAFVYTFALYRLVNLYTRAAIGEATAMAFLPLVAYGMYRILTAEPGDANFKTSFLPLACGMTGLIYTHLLSCEMAAPLLLAACLVCIRQFVRQPKRILSLLKAAGAALLMSLWFFVPMLDYMRQGSYQLFAWSVSDRTPEAVNLAQLFPLLPSGGGESNPGVQGIPGEMALGVGFGMLAVLLAYIPLYRAWNRHPGRLYEKKSNVGLTLFSYVAGLICLWMATNLFPWSWMFKAGGVTASLTNMLQFPWRMLAPASLLLTVAFCQCAGMWTQMGQQAKARLFTGVVAGLLLITAVAYYDAMLRETPVFRAYVSADIDQSRGIGDGEYLPVGFAPLPEDRPVAENCVLEEAALSGTHGVLYITNPGQGAGYVELPRTFYPGYRAKDENGAVLTLAKSDNGLLKLQVPQGFSGRVRIDFAEPILWRGAEALSLLTAVALGIYAYRKRRFFCEDGTSSQFFA